jgi:signal transduction histidine kinase
MTYFEILGQLTRRPKRRGRGELRLLRDSTFPFYAHLEAVPLRYVDQPGCLLAAFVDITERKRAEDALQETYEQLRGLSARLLSVQEEERKRIARELHDSLGQTLAAMKFNVEHVLANREQYGREALFRFLERFIPIIQGAVHEVRTINSGLRPTVLDDIGIVAAIRWFCREFKEAWPKFRVEVSTEIEENEVPENLKIVIFRIIQEALNNAAKHSNAEWVNLSLVRGEKGIDLMVRDGGIGFDVQAARKGQSGMGLVSMRERAELTGGTFSIESVPGEGTVVKVCWPEANRAVLR